MPKLIDSPTGANGTQLHRVNAAATTNATLVKAGASQLFGVSAFNASAAVRFLKLYNKATAPVVGTDIPVWVIGIPVGSFREIDRPNGVDFSLGLAYATTVLIADSDATAIAANDISASLTFF